MLVLIVYKNAHATVIEDDEIFHENYNDNYHYKSDKMCTITGSNACVQQYLFLNISNNKCKILFVNCICKRFSM